MKMGFLLLIRLYIIAAVWMAAPCGVHAQGKLPSKPRCSVSTPVPPDVDREMRRLYMAGLRNFTNNLGLAYADTLYKLCKKEGFVDGQLSAMMLRVKNASVERGNLEKMDRALRPLMGLAMSTGNIEYFYSGVSFRATYLINEMRYKDAIDYQNKMIKYAKEHGHTYGMIVGLVSLGNMYRMHMQMAQALDAFGQVLELYKKYPVRKHDLGIDYKRIVECYLISYDFQKAVEMANVGISSSHLDASIGGLYCYRALAQFMLGQDVEFVDSYNRYKACSHVAPDVQPLVKNSVEAMMLIHEGKYKEAEDLLASKKMGGYKTYVEMVLYKRQNRLPEMLEAMRKYSILLYGDSGDALPTDFMHISGEVMNNLAELDRQKAANENSRLHLTYSRLELKATELELLRSRDAEHLAMTAAEARHISLTNQRLLSRQLGDSLANQRMLLNNKEQQRLASRIRFSIVLAAIVAVTVLALVYLWRNKKMAGKLKRTNLSLQRTLDDITVASAKAQESDRQKTEFIQNMSHEIRTPLNAIVGFSQVLTDSGTELDEEERQNVIKIINDNSGLLNTLINDILDMTSIESGRYEIKRERVSVNMLCHRALDATRERKAEGVHMRFETGLPDEFTITTDGYRVMQILVNMLSNAVKNTSEGSIVLGCSLADHAGALTFTVTDTGSGVPCGMYEKIFERFYKVDQFKQGVGLGLGICRSIAAKLGGAIDIDRTYTGGARFWFALPLDVRTD